MHANDGRTVSVVIPVFNNESTIEETVERIFALQEGFAAVNFDVVLVEDGSKDSSWSVCADLAKLHPSRLTAYRLSRNFGQVNALAAGLARATGDAIIVISADLQDPVDLMPNMIKSWQSGTDIVVAHRESRQDDWFSKAFSKIAYRVARSGNPHMPEGGFDFFLISRRAVDVLNSYATRHRFLQGDILWMGFPTTFIPYERQERPRGKSGWTLGKKFKYFTDLVLDSSYAPIQLMSRLGFVVALAGILYALVIAIAYFLNQTPFPGWAPIMVTLLFLGGTIMIMMGVIGEYLWRIYDEIKAKPLYVVQERAGGSQTTGEQESL